MFNSNFILDKYKSTRNELINQLLSGAFEFHELAIALFHFQYEYNAQYRDFCTSLGTEVNKIESIDEIPCLPISAFKHHDIVTGPLTPIKTFLSSGTTGADRSRHLFHTLDIYKHICKELFESSITPLEHDLAFFSLLPSYLENGNSSLVYMAQYLMSYCGQSNFYLYEFDALARSLESAMRDGKKIVLLGVAYALLDFGRYIDFPLTDHIIIETGGMKGRRTELLKEELHSTLQELYDTDSIVSEYGMTELSTQFYAVDNGIFSQNRYAQVFVTQLNDPFAQEKTGKTGRINIIDLGNIDSCAFIQTEDLGRIIDTQGFQIIGRLDNSDLRGCNLLYSY